MELVLSKFTEPRAFSCFNDIDIKCVYKNRSIGALQKVNYSISRDKTPIYTMGSSLLEPKKSIAGSLVFIQFDVDPIYKEDGWSDQYYVGDEWLRTCHRQDSLAEDVIPPFDIVLITKDDGGNLSVMKIIDVELSHKEHKIGPDDIVMDYVFQFTAREIIPWGPAENKDHTGQLHNAYTKTWRWL
jgi:hypothetical protein